MSERFAIIPAVDIREGRCVRLYQGDPEKETVFSDDPAEMARRWESEGADLLHLVDLDGAFQGVPVNFDVVARAIAAVRVPVEVGGGIRDTDSAARYLDAGAARVVVGTRAYADEQWLLAMVELLGERLVVGIDARQGRVMAEGWTGEAGMSALNALKRLEADGVRRVIYTDVSRDGTLDGPDFKGLEDLARAAGIPVVASGGVAGERDVVRLSRLGRLGVEGAIIGMALYRGTVTMQDIIEALREEEERAC